MGTTVSSVSNLIAIASAVVASSFSSIPTEPSIEPEIAVASDDTIEIIEDDGKRHRCAITILEPKFVLTAGHCGESRSLVEINGISIGIIEDNYLYSGQGLDMAEISLAESITAAPLEADVSYRPTSGDELFLVSELSGRVTGTANHPDLFTRNIRTPEGAYPAVTWIAHLAGQRGDSGAPILHDGKVVGLVEGGDLKERTLVTPLQGSVGAKE